MSPFEKIEMCRDLAPLIGVHASAAALAESSNGFVSFEIALELIAQPGVPMGGRIVVAEPPS